MRALARLGEAEYKMSLEYLSAPERKGSKNNRDMSKLQLKGLPISQIWDNLSLKIDNEISQNKIKIYESILTK